jgi:hypothetical protein
MPLSVVNAADQDQVQGEALCFCEGVSYFELVLVFSPYPTLPEIRPLTLAVPLMLTG